jgi:uncharacterized iron-regulated membrane protein
MLLRRVLFQVHLWTGLATGVYVFVVCVSGAALVFRLDLQKALHPHLFTPGAGPAADPATVMAAVHEAYPRDRLAGVDAPTTARPTYLAYVLRGDRFLTVLVDPASARALGELPERSVVRRLQDLHFDLLAGPRGRVANGIGALSLLLMCLTGLVIWWPGLDNWRRSLVVDPTRSWRRITWELHGAAGIWTVAFVMMWAVTGVYFAFPVAFRSAVDALSPLTTSRSLSSDRSMAGAAAPPTWRALIDRARQQMPGRVVARVVVPADDAGAFHVLFAETSPTPVGAALESVYLDQHTGEVLAERPRGPRTAGDVVMAWIAPLHVGSFGGAGVKAAWLVLGLTPPLLFVTGVVMWWTRVVRRRWPAPHAARDGMALRNVSEVRGLR